MGWDIIYKVKHNLDISSIDLLIADLAAKLSCNVVKYLGDDEKDLAKELDIDINEYDNDIDILTSDYHTIFVTDSLFVARSLVMMYGENAQKILEHRSDKQYLISELDDVRSGAVRYKVDNGCLSNLNSNEIWNISGETLYGSPDFPTSWILFEFLFDSDHTEHRDKTWRSFTECRKKLYNYLKPIIKDIPVYYLADQGSMQFLNEIDTIKELNKGILQYKLATFNLSQYILYHKNETCKEPYNTVFIDDFKDIINSYDY